MAKGELGSKEMPSKKEIDQGITIRCLDAFQYS